jgi:hypothetical protein
MARTVVANKDLRLCSNNKAARARVKTKLDEHDAALDQLLPTAGSGAGTKSRAYVYAVRGVQTSNLASFAGISTTFDGLTLVAGDRILVSAQSTAAQNGIYVVGTVAGGVATWTRAVDFGATALIPNGSLFIVAAGTNGAGRTYQLTNTGPISIGTTGLTFQRLYNSTELAAETSGLGADLIGSYDTGSIFAATTVRGQLQEVKAIADAAIALQKRTVTVVEGDLSGTSQAVNVGAVLPANAIVLAHELKVNTQFAGQSDLTITLGGTVATAIVASTDLDALIAGNYSGTLGAHPRGSFSAEQLVATFAATALADLSAGSITITVWFSVLA